MSSVMMGDVPLDLPVASALIGRAAELDRLAALTGLDDKEPRAAAVLLSGDAGIGKTRLMSALRALPRDLAGLLLVRLDQLDESASQVVRVASAAGRGIDHDVLAEVAGLDGTALEHGLRNAVERRVLVPAGPDSYAFRHAMLGEAVYDDLLPGERVRLHAAFVRALAARVGVGTSAELARHARAAHDPATALRASVLAGDEAASVGGPDEALRHYRLALELSADDAALDYTSVPINVVELTIKASAAATAAGHLHKAIALVQERLGVLSICSAMPATAAGRSRSMMTQSSV